MPMSRTNFHGPKDVGAIEVPLAGINGVIYLIKNGNIWYLTEEKRELFTLIWVVVYFKAFLNVLSYISFIHLTLSYK